MNKYHFLALVIIIASASLIPHADSWIPPTNAFSKIYVGLTHINANNASSSLIYKCTGCTITLQNQSKNSVVNFNVAAINTPVIVSTISLINQTTSIGATNLYTVPTSGLYRVSVYQVNPSSITAGTLSSTIAWTDQTGTTQGQKPASDLNLNILHTFSNGESFIDTQASTNITFQTALTGILGTPKYDLFITVEKLS